MAKDEFSGIRRQYTYCFIPFPELIKGILSFNLGNAAESDHTFKDITFGEGEWYDYDEEGECSVSVTEIEHRLEHFK